MVAITAGALLVAGGGVAVAGAHKVVTLDVDGEVQQVSTFAGAVRGLLADQDLVIGEHDAVTPDATSPLADGATVVVRSGKQLTFQVDGEETTVWSTALTADEAIAVLQARGSSVALLPSRSSGGRAELPVDLSVRGQVDVVADGLTQTLTAAQGLDEALASLDLTVGELDRIQVHRSTETGRLTVLLQRVVVAEEAVAVPVETAERATDALYKGQRRTATDGVPGERTQVFSVTRVDGEEESRELLSDELTTPPVDKVIEVGTKARPVAAPAASSGAVVSGDVWAALAQCESGGNPKAVSSSGRYYGLYQFSLSTWQSVGGSGLPTDASADEQTARAQALQARSGWGQWPACSTKLGLR